MTDGFSLAAFIRQLARDEDVIDPAKLAALAAERIPASERDAALRSALTSFSREVMGRDRPPAGFTAPLTAGASQANSGRSSRVARIRLAYLESSYSIGGTRKRLGDCTFDDLIVIAGGMEHQAETLMVKAADFRALARALHDNNAPTVRELPPELLRQIFPA